jgi:hypothetical protein
MMIQLNKHRKQVILLIIVTFLIGCKGKKDIDRLLENPVCEFPCWQTIRPGITTKSEYINIISSLKHIDKDSIYSTEEAEERYQYYISTDLFYQANTPIRMGAYFQKNVVARMQFSGPMDYTLQEMIEIFGEPTNVAISGHILVAFIYPQKGISFGYNSISHPDWVFSEIRPDAEINKLDFYNPSLYEDKVSGGLFSSGSRIFPWKGYGDLKTLYSFP